MRRLRPDPEPDELIMKVLNAGVQAPSGQNSQPWEFVLIDDKARKKWFAERYGAAMESRFGIPQDAAKRGHDRMNAQMRAICHQIAHRAVGLGAALTTMHQVLEEELHAYFEIPVEFGVVVTIPIGWPMGKFGAVTRIPAEQKTHRNKW